MSYYREMVQDMDDSQKLELVSILIESVKPIQTHTVFDMPLEEDFPDMDKELYTPEEAYELTMKDIKAIYAIERTLPRRRPTISRWEGYHMANTDKWYYAYTIEGDTIKVVDVCHAQNMHE